MKTAVNLRMEQELRDLIDEACEEGSRNRSQQIVKYATEGLIRDGFLKKATRRKAKAGS